MMPKKMSSDAHPPFDSKKLRRKLGLRRKDKCQRI
jgi:hypothetical protein